METETLHQGRIAVTNPMDDTHKTFKDLKKAGITEAQAEVFTETFKGLADQTMQVNENLLLVRDELLGEFRKEFTGVRGEITGIRSEISGIRGGLKDIHHKIENNHKESKTDLASTNQELKHTRETLSNKIDSTRETLSIQVDAKFAHAQISNTRWNIGMFIGTVTMFIGLAGLIIALD